MTQLSRLLGQAVPVWYGPEEERHLSVLCPAGWDVVAAGVSFFLELNLLPDGFGR